MTQAVEGEPLPPLHEGESFPITDVDLKQVIYAGCSLLYILGVPWCQYLFPTGFGVCNGPSQIFDRCIALLLAFSGAACVKGE